MRPRFLPAILGVVLVACGGGAPSSQTTDGVEHATPALSGDAVYVDVRTAAEFATGHVQGALNIPVEELEARWGELEAYRDRPMVLYCRSGRRSGIAMDMLKQRGFALLENGVNAQALSARGVRTCGGGVPC